MSDTEKKFHPVPGHRQRPLVMQLALASGAMAQSSLSQSEDFGNDFWLKGAGRQAQASMGQVVEGLKKYQLHPYERKPLSRSVMWSDGQARFVWYAAQLKKNQKKAKAGIVIIPSLINSADILDILPEERSFIRWLTGQGLDVFLLEWNDLREDPELETLDGLLGMKLPRMLTRLKADYTDSPLFGLGYCMGGLFLAASEVLCPTVFKGLVFVATPWDFTASARGNFAESIIGWAKEGLSRVVHLDFMPAEWLQMIFAGVDPSIVARKFTAFADMKQDSLDARLFVAVEDWVNGGGDLPAGIVQQTVRDWYLANKPVHGKWLIGDIKIDAKKIEKPSLSIIPAKDKIVPPESAMALAVKIPDADILTPDCGHISMMVSSRAQEEVWEPMICWILDVVKLIK